jgi:hypothetical protein
MSENHFLLQYHPQNNKKIEILKWLIRFHQIHIIIPFKIRTFYQFMIVLQQEVKLQDYQMFMTNLR